MKYNDLPVYNIVLDMNDDSEGLELVSIVDSPAVCETFLKFNSDEKIELIFATDNEEHIISGVCLLADTPIYRCDESNPLGYYVVFTKQTIKDLVEKYNKENKTNLTSLQHNGKVINDCIMVESYFIDKERGICPKEFEHCPDGSWITSYKVTNEDLWQDIKNSGTLNGFSVEIMCSLEPAKESQIIYEEPQEFSNYEIDEEDEFWKRLGEWIMGEVDENPLDNFADDKKKSKKKKDVVIPQPKIEEPKIEPAYADRYEEAIKKHQWLIVNYNDGQEEPHIRARQGFITAYGYTEAGNLAVRFWERFGDSRSVSEGDSIIPDWRILLDERITSWKVIPNVEPWTDADLGYGYHNGGDDSLSFPLIMAYTMGE